MKRKDGAGLYVTGHRLDEIGQGVTYYLAGPFHSNFQFKKALRKAQRTNPSAKGMKFSYP